MLAQVDPRGDVRTFTTQHFRVHFPVALEPIARMAAARAEVAWSDLSTELAPPAFPVELLLADNVDLANGFATTFPTNRITVYVLPPVALTELRFHDDWLRLVITHELTHIFHIDRARGVWRVGRAVFGRNPVLFPNALLPSWIKEGMAVHYESEFTGSGRIAGTEARSVAVAAARARAVPGPDAWSAATSSFPAGETPYAWGSTLMHRMAEQGGAASMRRFTDETATFPIPFLLDRAAKRGFGRTFTQGFREWRDSLVQGVVHDDTTGDARWQPVVREPVLGAFYAAYPRWSGADSIQWVASNGREPAGLYSARVPTGGGPVSLESPHRVARRNSLDVNALALDGTSVFSQVDYRGAYVLRSDLYTHDRRGEHRLTRGARLVQPDVRAQDGAIVALQFVAGGTRLVRVSRANGVVSALTHDATVEWAEPRWSPDGRHVAAIEMLATGTQRVVVLDTTGALVAIVTEARAVFATPSFTPDGMRLLWSSDRSGRTQLETASIAALLQLPDTLRRSEAHSASAVSTGVYQPSVSPDGGRVAALVYRANGFVVVVGALDTAGPPARERWYQFNRSRPDTTTAYAGSSAPYHAFRQLWPRYWQPVIGQGRDGGATYGAATSGTDILGRHSYAASALANFRTREVTGALDYQYAGLGMPVVDVSVWQDRDATFRVADSAGASLGLLARRRQFASVALGWSEPRVRWSGSYAIGVGYERRTFSGTSDAVLGPSGSAFRTGTRYPSLFASGGISTLASGARGISAEQGVAASGSVTVRRREGVSNSESWRTVGVVRAFQPLPLPGFARHVVAARVAGGVTDTRAPSAFDVGGVSGLLSEVVPGVSIGDPSRTFPVRGFVPGTERGVRALSGSVEYRAPLSIVSRGAGLFPLFLDKLSLGVFGDAARAWCPAGVAEQAAALCDAPSTRDGWLASVGAELNVDLALQYDVPYRFRVGFARPFAAPIGVSRGASVFVTLGAFF